MKGRSWSLQRGGIVFGRSVGCDVSILDPAVSRRQCRLFFEDGQVCLEDLGSRNPALVNGAPLAKTTLKAGDEITLGVHRFVLAVDAGEHGPGQAEETQAFGTQSWAEGELITIEVASVRKGMPPGPQTISDLFFLYDSAREMSGAESIDGLAAILVRRLQERFAPRRMWLALVHDERELTFLRHSSVERGEESAIPRDLIQQALEQRCGILAPTTRRKGKEKLRGFMLVAPATAQGENVALMALETELPHGAYDEDYLRLLVLLGQAIGPVIRAVASSEQTRRENEWLRLKAGESDILVGESRGIVAVRGQIALGARSSLSTLITGETGTGKELAANMIHAQSGRRHGPFVVVNCAAIPRDLFESEFFGHEKGAFTGASEVRVGLIEQAHGGTLFLDEIGDLSLENQARILRGVELGTFRRVGGKNEISVDIRVVAATNKDLAAQIKKGGFREDLYHRLNGFTIHIPPLRSRPSDIPLLAKHFLEMARHQARRPLTGFQAEALEHLASRNWPGNVRELRNCIQRAVAVARGPQIRSTDLLDRPESSGSDETPEKPLSLAEIERAHIVSVMQWCGGDIDEAARILQIGRATLYRKLAEYGLK
jgi:DNA-binding NtrC family response regulator